MEIWEIPLSKRQLRGYFYKAGDGKKPAILYLHDLLGVQETTHEAAMALSREGFHVLIVDLFSGGGIVPYCLHYVFNTLTLLNEENSPGVLEARELVGFLRNRPEVDAQRLGFVGQCLTGGYALHAALWPGVRAPVVFHHSLGLWGSGFPQSCAQRVATTIQGHFSHFDIFCPPWRIAELEKQLGERLERHDYQLPHAIPHLFSRTEEGRRAWHNMLRFFHEKLGS
ncbi:MAG: dienelactone hydrolase family protein [Leptospiraceae bacterium]|nr:dienelactone hydrolase family protein [Leptospiraceae bacterium]MDW8305705.1 dienelactone hydrolase family protein [Leptospiraceae bacterium]